LVGPATNKLKGVGNLQSKGILYNLVNNFRKVFKYRYCTNLNSIKMEFEVAHGMEVKRWQLPPCIGKSTCICFDEIHYFDETFDNLQNYTERVKEASNPLYVSLTCT